MLSGGVTVRARGASDPVEAVAQARRKRRHSEGSSMSSPSRQLNFPDARRDDDEREEGGLQRKKKKQRASEVAARKRIRDVIAEEEEEGKAVEHHDDEEEEEAYVEEEGKEAEPEAEPRTPPRTPPRKKRASSDGDAPRNAKTRSRGTPNGLRRTVRMWTKEEENQLIAGVRKHGMGAWRKILEEGEDVFHTHRTNVDLKDKWKNLVRREANFPAREERNLAARRMAARLSLSSQGLPDDDNASVASSHNSTVNVEEMFPEIDDEDGASRDARRRSSSSQGGDETVKLLICTDDSPSHMRSLSIALRRCPTVSALKRQLTRRLLDDSPLPTNLQLVSITTRRLLADLEALDECIKRDGREFFLLYDPGAKMTIRHTLHRLRGRVRANAHGDDTEDDEDDHEPVRVRTRFLKAWLGIVHADDAHPLLRPKKRYVCDVVVYVWCSGDDVEAAE